MEMVNNMFGLQNKVALVTGGTRGLGEAIAKLFLDAGASVVITGRDASTGLATRDKLAREYEAVRFVRQDVADEENWQEVTDFTVQQFGGLDILVNNAGVHWLNTLETETLESFRNMQQVNVEGTFLGIQSAIAVMKPGGASARGGSIINVSSVAGINGFVSHAAYGTSKASVRGLSKVAALECAQFGYGIRVNSVHPAVIPTDMAPDMWQQFIKLGMVEDEQGAQDMVTAMHPLGLGTPEDVAAACLYLASDASRWVTGTELILDGGLQIS